jgi:hypothetical protein
VIDLAASPGHDRRGFGPGVGGARYAGDGGAVCAVVDRDLDAPVLVRVGVALSQDLAALYGPLLEPEGVVDRPPFRGGWDIDRKAKLAIPVIPQVR